MCWSHSFESLSFNFSFYFLAASEYIINEKYDGMYKQWFMWFVKNSGITVSGWATAYLPLPKVLLMLPSLNPTTVDSNLGLTLG